MLKRHALTLVEVLIALSLMTLLLTTLLFWHHHLTRKKGEIEKLKRPYIEERYLMQRLDRILPKTIPPFQGDATSLVFRFDRGISDDPRLSETVLGKLYYDEQLQSLCLGIWPDPEEWEAVVEPSLTLTLLDQVESLTFHYYCPPDPFQKIVDPEEVGKPRPQEGWQETWVYEQLPAFVYLELEHAGQERELRFDLEQPIYYPLENG